MKLWHMLVPLRLVTVPLRAIGLAGWLRLRLRPERRRSPLTARLHHQPGEQLRRRIFHLIRPQAPRRAVPFLRRSLEGRWQVGDGATSPDEPIDPDARVVAPAPDSRAARR